MRRDASIFSKMTFSYPKPLLDASMKGDISFEQYGDLPEDLKMKDAMKGLESNMKYYIEKEPDSKNSVIKAIWATNGPMFALFVAGRLILTAAECYHPVLLQEFV